MCLHDVLYVCVCVTHMAKKTEDWWHVFCLCAFQQWFGISGGYILYMA